VVPSAARCGPRAMVSTREWVEGPGAAQGRRGSQPPARTMQRFLPVPVRRPRMHWRPRTAAAVSQLRVRTRNRARHSRRSPASSPRDARSGSRSTRMFARPRSCLGSRRTQPESLPAWSPHINWPCARRPRAHDEGLRYPLGTPRLGTTPQPRPTFAGNGPNGLLDAPELCPLEAMAGSVAPLWRRNFLRFATRNAGRWLPFRRDKCWSGSTPRTPYVQVTGGCLGSARTPSGQ
jgi:hypothetical protein